MQSDNLRRNPSVAEFIDGTDQSLEYQILQQNVITRAKAYQTYLNKVCKSHINYQTSELSEIHQNCINKTLDQLAPLVANVEQYYDELHHSKYNIVGFVDYLKQLDKQSEAYSREAENRQFRFGKGSFFESYRTFMK